MPVRTFSGERLKQFRNDRRLTQHDLASRLRSEGFGTTQTTVSRWEDGQQPHSSVLPSLASALGVEMDELYGSDDDEDDDPVVALMDALRRVVREEMQSKTLERT